MRILWLLYRGKNSRYILLLELGEHNGKLCGIDTSKINDRDRAIIMSSSRSLRDMTLQKRVAWIKKHCKGAMAGYREIHKYNAQEVSAHEVGYAR